MPQNACAARNEPALVRVLPEHREVTETDKCGGLITLASLAREFQYLGAGN
jgi:hypothetical protein